MFTQPLMESLGVGMSLKAQLSINKVTNVRQIHGRAGHQVQ